MPLYTQWENEKMPGPFQTVRQREDWQVADEADPKAVTTSLVLKKSCVRARRLASWSSIFRERWVGRRHG
jgi:hypothetical protein